MTFSESFSKVQTRHPHSKLKITLRETFLFDVCNTLTCNIICKMHNQGYVMQDGFGSLQEGLHKKIQIEVALHVSTLNDYFQAFVCQL